VRHLDRHRRLLASLAATGQQTPIVVVAAAHQPDRYLVIDGYKRIAALEQLGRDTVEAVLWPISEADALVLNRSMRMSEQETALEQGWLLAELERHFNLGQDELARRFDRSISWISRRLALVDLLPEGIQQQVREGRISAHVAMKFLVPGPEGAPRVSLDDCQRMAEIFAKQHCNTRQAGQLYAAWRDGTAKTRERILQQPELWLKAQRQAESKPPPTPAGELLRDLEMAAAILSRATRRLSGAAPDMDRAQGDEARHNPQRARKQLDYVEERIAKEQEHVESSTTNRDPGTGRSESEQTRDCAGAERIPADGAQSPAVELRGGARVTPPRESRTLPANDPGSFPGLQGESRPGP
jgi:ParB/RepB/Spo0J family partition protein